MRRLVVFLLLLISSLPIGAQAAPARHDVWFHCALHLDWPTATHVVRRQCWTVPMPREHRRPAGWRITRRHVSPHVETSTRFPTFPQPAQPTPAPASGYTVWLQVTGYAWGCGASQRMSSGLWPFYGAVASNVLPQGSHVDIPSLGYSGTVLDTGAPLDVFEPNCAATYAVTGYRQVVVSP